MGTRYDQLRLAERCEIVRLRAGGLSLRRIAQQLGRSPATISRELRRNALKTNAWPGGYEPDRAQALAERRRRWDCRFKMARQPDLRERVRQLLAMGWSPEQIAGRLAREDASMRISHESIYRFVYHRSAQKDYWHRLLPSRKNRRGRLRRGGLSPLRSMKRRTSIHERPDEADDRRNPGHWEADLMIFERVQGNANVATVVERTSRFTVLFKNNDRQSKPIMEQLITVLSPLPRHARQSLTFDRGFEFVSWRRLKQGMGADAWFCYPAAPWQKGSVENMNLRIRRYLPRDTAVLSVPDETMGSLIDQLNNTPRKCLGFRTPAEVFRREMNK